jgi:hypothetical protein
MPLPTPNNQESQADYMARCVPQMVDEGRPQNQAVTMCMSTFMKGPPPMPAASKAKTILGFVSNVTIVGADADKKKPATFDAEFYTGGMLDIEGWDLPVVVDLAGVQPGNVLVANLDHESSQRVGNFQLQNTGAALRATGSATAATPARDEVVRSAADGYRWQASIEAKANKTELVKAGKMVTVNGQTFKGPIYVVRSSTLKGFAFVSHGADDNTTASIAATAASSHRSNPMDAKVAEWLRAMVPSLDLDSLTDQQVANLEADYAGQPGKRRAPAPGSIRSITDAVEAEEQRLDEIRRTIEATYIRSPNNREQIRALGERAENEKWTPEKLRGELWEATLPVAAATFNAKPGRGITQKVIEAAICQSGRLANIEKHYDAQTLDVAGERFPNGIGLKQLWCISAEAQGFKPSYDVDLECHRAAFGMLHGAPGNGRQFIRGEGFSTLSLPNILSNVANKYLMQGWMSVDQTPLAIATVRNVRDFKQTTTVSLTGGLMFQQVGPDGELKSAELGETVYKNQAATYGIICQITRTDIINDDLNAITATPARIGRGGMLKLNDIFWRLYLNNSAFYTSGNKNVSTGSGSALSLAGLTAAEVVFLNQQDPDGNPLGMNPSILLVPPSLKSTALALMQSGLLIGSINTTTGVTTPSTNVFQGRYNVQTSPYMENTNYTGYGTTVWYLLAAPTTLPTAEIAALNGRPEPTVQTADAEFSVLGVSMRGYSDVGVAFVEPRAGVRSAGS